MEHNGHIIPQSHALNAINTDIQKMSGLTSHIKLHNHIRHTNEKNTKNKDSVVTNKLHITLNIPNTKYTSQTIFEPPQSH